MMNVSIEEVSLYQHEGIFKILEGPAIILVAESKATKDGEPYIIAFPSSYCMLRPSLSPVTLSPTLT